MFLQSQQIMLQKFWIRRDQILSIRQISALGKSVGFCQIRIQNLLYP